jgi:hypothetical protein
MASYSLFCYLGKAMAVCTAHETAPILLSRQHLGHFEHIGIARKAEAMCTCAPPIQGKSEGRTRKSLEPRILVAPTTFVHFSISCSVTPSFVLFRFRFFLSPFRFSSFNIHCQTPHCTTISRIRLCDSLPGNRRQPIMTDHFAASVKGITKALDTGIKLAKRVSRSASDASAGKALQILESAKRLQRELEGSSQVICDAYTQVLEACGEQPFTKALIEDRTGSRNHQDYNC